ncbi:hypothetical protein A2U01_0101641 [Trifolium medium]|uniref:Uncharacterized protein n=1 Tax=Trifolium medium TaxID=97028 RepID=A0A392V1S8_9FABA|nr:hypothetical protein [Trifolium medium]
MSRNSLPAALRAGSWAQGAPMSRNTACCAMRRPMGAGCAYELGRFDFADILEKLVSWRAL